MNWDYGLGLWFFARGVALVYAIAFLSLLVQIKGLFGENGILPIKNYLNAAARVYGRQKFLEAPTVFWFRADDPALTAVCLTGLAASVGAFLGWSQGPLFLVDLICYLSLETAGQDFLSFQWDVLLIETGYLVLFVAPFKGGGTFFDVPTPSISILLLIWWLLFRLNFSSGAVKIASRDETWKNLTALRYHYETQPLPNPAAWGMHQKPLWFQKISTALMFLCELVAPFFIFAPGPFKLVAFFALAGLQVLIQVTGNYGFFNLLTLVFCLPLLSDTVWKSILPGSWMAHFKIEGGNAWGLSPVLLMLAITIVALSVFWLLRIFNPRFNVRRRLSSSFLGRLLPFRIANTYGLFAVMTTSRPEIVIEGSHDGVQWKAYEFKWKPGRLNRRPPLVAPHQPRLDWQMWFAALGTLENNPWIQNLFLRLLEGRPEVLALLKENPFREKPPTYLRALLYDYHFTTRSEKKQKGNWWKRELIAEYSPVVGLQ